MSELTTEVRLARMALRAFRNNNIATNLFYKDLNSEFKNVEAGGIVNVRKPIKFHDFLCSFQFMTNDQASLIYQLYI